MDVKFTYLTRFYSVDQGETLSCHAEFSQLLNMSHSD